MAITSEANLLIDYDYGNESDEEEPEILFEDLADLEIDQKAQGNYLKLNADHLKKISVWHIRANLALQVISWLLVSLTFWWC